MSPATPDRSHAEIGQVRGGKNLCDGVHGSLLTLPLSQCCLKDARAAFRRHCCSAVRHIPSVRGVRVPLLGQT